MLEMWNKTKCMHECTLSLHLRVMYKVILAPIEYPTSVTFLGVMKWNNLHNISAVTSIDKGGSSAGPLPTWFCIFDLPCPGRSIAIHLADPEMAFMMGIQSSPVPRKPWRKTMTFFCIKVIIDKWVRNRHKLSHSNQVLQIYGGAKQDTYGY